MHLGFLLPDLWTAMAPQDSGISELAGYGGTGMGRYFLVCGVLLSLVLGLTLFFRRFVAGTLKARAAQRSLAALDVLPLGGKQKLVVVRCYDRSFLIGAGEKELTLLAELDEPVADIPLAPQAPPQPEAQRTPPAATTAEFLRALQREETRTRSIPEEGQPRRLSESGRGILG